MFKLVGFLKGYKKELFLGPVFKLAEAVFELLVPLVMKDIIDVGVRNGDLNYVLKKGCLILLFGIIGYCSTLVCQYFGAVASQGTGTVLRRELFHHINSFTHTELNRFSPSELLVRLTNDINQVQQAAGMLIRLAIRAPFLVIGSIIMSLIIDVKLSLIIIAVAPVIAAAIYKIMQKTVPLYNKVQRGLEEISRISGESLSGMRVIRAFSEQDRQNRRFAEAGNTLSENYVRAGKLSALLNPVTVVLVNLGIIAVLWFGGIEVYSGNLTQGEIIALVNYLTQLTVALLAVANLLVVFTKAGAGAVRINEIFDIKPSLTDSGNIMKSDESAPAVEFKNTVFSYGNAEPSLKGISLVIERGEKIGIIGGTGSGKTTLASLIPRFYDAAEGEVRIYGVNVKDIPTVALRSRVSVCAQRASVLSGSVKENLRLGNTGADDGKLWTALADAQAEDFVREKGGLEARLEQGGRNLSGGQKQRIAIARTLASDAGIVILDDCFSALDVVTEKRLRNALNERCRLNNTTVIIISQRISSLRGCDRIAVMDDGKIVGYGTHEQLYDRCEIYREICRSQFEGEEEREND